VRKVGPRPGSTTATTTFDWLGTSNTIPSRSGPRPATLTSSPGPIVSTEERYRANALIGAVASVDRNQRPQEVGPAAGSEPLGLVRRSVRSSNELAFALVTKERQLPPHGPRPQTQRALRLLEARYLISVSPSRDRLEPVPRGRVAPTHERRASRSGLPYGLGSASSRRPASVTRERRGAPAGGPPQGSIR
jgi:hypothetical protein